MTKHAIKGGSFNHLLLAAPTVDITNLNTKGVKASDNIDGFKQKIEMSCQTMMKVAHDALKDNPHLEKIMHHAPRYDTQIVDPVGLKPNLANFANNYLLELWLESPLKDKIFIGSHNLDCTGEIRMKRYRDDKSKRYDGVHLYGSAGKEANTESVLNILLSSFQAQTYPQAGVSGDDDHRRCPQTKYKKQQRTYSSVVKEKSNIQTQNRFSPLSGFSGNE